MQHKYYVLQQGGVVSRTRRRTFQKCKRVDTLAEAVSFQMAAETVAMAAVVEIVALVGLEVQ